MFEVINAYLSSPASFVQLCELSPLPDPTDKSSEYQARF